MSGHFPFSAARGTSYGLAPRMAISAFFEKNQFDMATQEAYYKWWYDWTKAYVEQDADLKATMVMRFKHYPMGQHSEHGFHLNGKYWASCMDDLGAFIRNLILPKLDHDAEHALAEEHEKMVHDLKAQATANYTPAPDVGLFRHV
ncbi:hypothetical protein [Acidihalobacter ferrooxydans]|uniref:Uncharacterized protein n=1 Tax=Acidihalobacter ferrooxydans TaxID=1765967 RepID=A0A1P8UEB9_9GAMM|nr:hypothetical protein [Acidihalobacter ferrooxydans]APZ42202.1 hypothetical protein BW247_03085 [Acidihalobacter ferrooxydans]